MTKTKSLIIYIIIMGIILTGCGENGVISIPGTSNTDNSKVETSTEISIPIEKFRSLNPILNKDEDVYFMEKLVYEGLVKLDDNLIAIPAIAEGWSYTDEGKTMIFNIRGNVYWHDGKQLTSTDVKFTIDALMRLQYSNPSIYTKNITNIKSVAVNGSQQVMIKFKSLNDNSIENFCFPIIPGHQFYGLGDVGKNEIGFMPIGTGPYKVALSDEVQKVVLEANTQYYGEKKANNTLTFKIVPNKTEAVNLFEIGDLMVAFSKETDRQKIFGDKNVSVFPYISNEVEVLGFNTNNIMLKDKRVRLAIATAIDTSKIIEEAYYTNGVANDNIYFPNYLGINSTEGLIAQNIQKATNLLSEAGYINRDGDTFVEDSSGKEISINILVNSADASRVAAAEIIKNSLDKLPIHTYIMLKDWSGYTSALSTGDFEVYIGGWKINENYDLRFALHSKYNNVARYANPILDGYLDLMQSGISKEKKAETFIKVKAILNEEIPYYCLAYKTYAVATSKSLQGLVNPLFFNQFNQCEDWSYIK